MADNTGAQTKDSKDEEIAVLKYVVTQLTAALERERSESSMLSSQVITLRRQLEMAGGARQ